MLIYDPPLSPQGITPRSDLRRGAGYYPEQGLRDAVNVALALRRPLLLTGAPGCGKTALAASVAFHLGLPPPLVFATKSQSQASDLFYVYDAMRRFQARETDLNEDPISYFTFNALGEAILRANAPDAVAQYLPAGFEHDGQTLSVVLIDEIDKAPRDFPNDLLDEIDEMRFRIPELGDVLIGAPRNMRPIVFITSNSEKDLPDPFLRRCVYYHIGAPDAERLRFIAEDRLGEVISGLHSFLDDAIDLFLYLRSDRIGLRRAPSTAELLDWLQALRRLFPETDNPLSGDRDRLASSLSAVIKNPDDCADLARHLWEWKDSRTAT